MVIRLASLAVVASVAIAATACGTSGASEDAESSEDNYTRYQQPEGGTSEGGGEGGVSAEIQAEAPGIELDSNGMPKEKSVGGFSFGGCEYWPFAVSASPYPDHIVWGCSPGSSPQANACMAAGMRRLAVILQDPPQELLDLKEQRGISSFFNWNNDYYGAPEGRVGTERLWLYNGGLIKWITMTDRDGSCRLPERSDLVNFAKRCLQATPGEDGRIKC
jgi:hypothetical protein